MKKTILFITGLAILLSVVSISLNSCVPTCQKVEVNGSINSDWIVIKQSSGRITDIYLLEDTRVKLEQNRDSWLFVDQDGNLVHINNSMKAIKVEPHNKSKMFNKYHEYHMEFETKTYEELYGKYEEPQPRHIRL
jgi:hypothetical protein